MNKIKDIIITALITLATALGTAVFLLWKLYAHEKELKNAHLFLKEAPEEKKEEVLKGLEIKQEGLNTTAWKLREEIENAKKEQIVYAFEKAFGVNSHSTDRNGSGSR